MNIMNKKGYTWWMIVLFIIALIIGVVIIIFMIAFLGPEDSPIVASIQGLVDQALGWEPDI